MTEGCTSSLFEPSNTLEEMKQSQFTNIPHAPNKKIPSSFPVIIHLPPAIPNTILSAHSDH